MITSACGDLSVQTVNLSICRFRDRLGQLRDCSMQARKRPLIRRFRATFVFLSDKSERCDEKSFVCLHGQHLSIAGW